MVDQLSPQEMNNFLPPVVQGVEAFQPFCSPEFPPERLEERNSWFEQDLDQCDFRDYEDFEENPNNAYFEDKIY